MPLSADGLRTRSVGLVCLAAGLSVAAAAHPASDHDALFTPRLVDLRKPDGGAVDRH